MNTNAKKAHVTIDLNDVMRHGSVSDAIIALAESDDATFSGIVGPSFSTSGPGAGWSRTHDANDFAERAFDQGALYYLDADDGRLAAQDEESGKWDGKWSVDSVVAIEVPNIDDALDRPAEFAELFKAAVETHSACSDVDGFRELIAKCSALADACADVE